MNKVLKMRLLGDTTDFQKKWMGASNTLTRFSAKATAVGNAVSAQGRKMAMELSLPIIAGLGAGVKAFSSFDKAMTESLAIMKNVSESTKKQMADLATQMSGQSTYSAKQLAESYYFLASAGLSAEKSIAALPVVTKFAQAGAFDMASATDLLTDAYSALGPAIQKTGNIMTDMTHLGDILVKANTLANASVQQFSEALTSEAGAAMRNFGVEVEDGIAVLAAFADQGEVKGAAAGSQFGRALRLLVKAQAANSEEFRRMGIEIFNAKGELNSFADIAKDMEDAFKGMSTKAKTAAMAQLGFQARTQQAILPLIGASEKIREYKRGLQEAGGITAEVADNQMKSFANQMTILKNKIVNAAAALGETLVPMVKKIAAKIEEWTAKFQALSPEMKEMTAKTLLWVAAIGPMLILAGSLIKMFGTLAIAIDKVGTALTFLAANPMVLLVTGVVAGIAAIVKLISVIHDWRDAVADAASTKDWLAGQTPIEELRKRRREQDALLAQAEKAKAVVSQSVAVAGPTPSVFVPSEEDKEAGMKFQDALNKAVFDQLGTEGKINKLIEERRSIEKDIAKTQKGSEAFYKAKQEALENETSLRELGMQRAQEIKDVAGKQGEQARQFAGAVEAGSVEDYKLRIRAGGKDAKEEIAKKQEKELVALNKKMAESVDILRRGFEVATGQSLKEVSIV